MKQLKENVKADNTLVLFISDNGAPHKGPAAGNNLPQYLYFSRPPVIKNVHLKLFMNSYQSKI